MVTWQRASFVVAARALVPGRGGTGCPGRKTRQTRSPGLPRSASAA